MCDQRRENYQNLDIYRFGNSISHEISHHFGLTPEWNFTSSQIHNYSNMERKIFLQYKVKILTKPSLMWRYGLSDHLFSRMSWGFGLQLLLLLVGRESGIHHKLLSLAQCIKWVDCKHVIHAKSEPLKLSHVLCPEYRLCWHGAFMFYCYQWSLVL